LGVADSELETSRHDDVHASPVSASLQAALVKAIRAERARMGLTQVELADRLGWSRQTVNKIEAGERMVLAHELVDICAAPRRDLRRADVQGGSSRPADPRPLINTNRTGVPQ
jgi:transcriptional regulator with XRE-family HTH domain